MWIKIFPLNPKLLDEEAKEEELFPVLLNLDHLLMVEVAPDYLTLYHQEMEPLIIRANGHSGRIIMLAIDKLTRSFAVSHGIDPDTYLYVTSDELEDEEKES